MILAAARTRAGQTVPVAAVTAATDLMVVPVTATLTKPSAPSDFPGRAVRPAGRSL